MGIRTDWIVADVTARNALSTTWADVLAGSESLVLSTGAIYRAVRAGSGATMWTPVTIAAISDEVATDEGVVSGTWNPTATTVTNMDSVGAVVGGYTRVGARVMVSGTVASADATTGSSNIAFSLSPLPVASNFGATTDATGLCHGAFANVGRVEARVATDDLLVTAFATNTSAGTLYFSASYRVI
jgi:hypothetical protein